MPARKRVEEEVDLRASILTTETQAVIARDDRERGAISECVDARRLISEWRRARRKQSRHGECRHAGEEISQRAVDTEVRRGKRFFRHRRHAQAREAKARLVK